MKGAGDLENQIGEVIEQVAAGRITATGGKAFMASAIDKAYRRGKAEALAEAAAEAEALKDGA